MPRLIQLVLAFCVTALVAGCQLALPGGKSASTDDVTPNAVAGDPIEVTALDAPPPSAATDAVLPPGAPEAIAAPQSDPAPPETVAETPPAPQPAPVVEVPPTPKSAAQLACEKKRGSWVPVSAGTLHTCVFSTKDAGKKCTRESQCEGQCLARSGTCSPLRPLLGCNEILQDNGARVTQCIE